jgi:hypothetical protein
VWSAGLDGIFILKGIDASWARVNHSEWPFNDLTPDEPNASSTYEITISREEDRGFGGASKAEVAQNRTFRRSDTSFRLEKRGRLEAARRPIGARITDSTVGSGHAGIFLDDGRAEQTLHYQWIHMPSNAELKGATQPCRERPSERSERIRALC